MPYKLLFEVRSLGFRDAGNSKPLHVPSWIPQKGSARGQALGAARLQLIPQLEVTRLI